MADKLNQFVISIILIQLIPLLVLMTNFPRYLFLFGIFLGLGLFYTILRGVLHFGTKDTVVALVKIGATSVMSVTIMLINPIGLAIAIIGVVWVLNTLKRETKEDRNLHDSFLYWSIFFSLFLVIIYLYLTISI